MSSGDGRGNFLGAAEARVGRDSSPATACCWVATFPPSFAPLGAGSNPSGLQHPLLALFPRRRGWARGGKGGASRAVPSPPRLHASLIAGFWYADRCRGPFRG